MKDDVIVHDYVLLPRPDGIQVRHRVVDRSQVSPEAEALCRRAAMFPWAVPEATGRHIYLAWTPQPAGGTLIVEAVQTSTPLCQSVIIGTDDCDRTTRLDVLAPLGQMYDRPVEEWVDAIHEFPCVVTAVYPVLDEELQMMAADFVKCWAWTWSKCASESGR